MNTQLTKRFRAHLRPNGISFDRLRIRNDTDGKNCPFCQNVFWDKAVVAVMGDGAAGTAGTAGTADETDDDKLEEDEAININYNITLLN